MYKDLCAQLSFHLLNLLLGGVLAADAILLIKSWNELSSSSYVFALHVFLLNLKLATNLQVDKLHWQIFFLHSISGKACMFQRICPGSSWKHPVCCKSVLRPDHSNIRLNKNIITSNLPGLGVT